MSNLFPRDCRAPPPLAQHGAGCYLYDVNGKQYLDGSGGAAVSCIGHGDRAVIAKITAQLEQLAFAHSGFFTSEPAEQLAATLIAHAPGHLTRAYFVSGGSEAVESAIKLARQYFIEIGEPSRHRIIARHQSYHGNTLGALAVGGNRSRRATFSPLLVETHHISPCYAYRGRAADESEADYGRRVADELEQTIHQLGASTVMAFIAEPVVGATLGAVAAVDGYFHRIREICDAHGILLILDEVMCGMGRTGSFFASEQDGVAADIVTIAKGLAAGYQPLGAMLCSGEIYAALEQGSGFFQHGHTYLGHPVACAAGLAVVEAMLARGLVARGAEQGENLRARLQDRFADHPHVGDIRGRGLFLGLELVADKTTKQPFPPQQCVHQKLKAATFEAGLICYPMGGTVDGIAGDHVLLAPPFIITDSQLDELVDKLAIGLTQAITAVR